MTAPEGNAAGILRLLRDQPRQAQDLAAGLGIDTSAARRHLENLRASGLVDSADVVAGPGRPKKLYHLTPAGRESFRRDYGLLLRRVLAKAKERQGDADVEALLKDVARDLGAPLSKGLPEARLDAVLALYNEMGFEASLERTPDGILLAQRNCIVLRAAEDDPHLLCRCFDEGILKAALPGAKVELRASQATGAPRCIHLVRLRKASA